MPKKKGKEDESSKEVEELLSAAQDHMLLDLRIGSHSTRDTSSLDGDLLRRFEALKKPSPSSSQTRISPPPEQTPNNSETVAVSAVEIDEELNRALGADLATRFAALKGIASFPASCGESQATPEKVRLEKEDDDDDVDEDGVSKKEVDKLIQWAMDAARLDPSMSSDDDADDDDGDKGEDDEHVRKDQSKRNKGKSLLQHMTHKTPTKLILHPFPLAPINI